MRKIIQCVQNDNKNVTVEDTIYAIKEAGFNGVFVQWYDKDWSFSQQQQVNLCRELGLEIEFAHLGYKGINNIWIDDESGDELVKNYLKDLDEIKKNNIPMVIMHLSSKSVAPAPSEIGVKRLKKVVDYAEKLGIKVAFENNKIFGYLEYLLDRIKNKNAGVCYDSGHCHCHYDDKFSWDNFDGRIFAVHLHDNDKSDDLHLLPFDGTIKWGGVIESLVNAGYDGPITLESCYRYQYLEKSVVEFYKESLERAKELSKFFS